MTIEGDAPMIIGFNSRNTRMREDNVTPEKTPHAIKETIKLY